MPEDGQQPMIPVRGKSQEERFVIFPGDLKRFTGFLMGRGSFTPTVPDNPNLTTTTFYLDGGEQGREVTTRVRVYGGVDQMSLGPEGGIILGKLETKGLNGKHVSAMQDVLVTRTGTVLTTTPNMVEEVVDIKETRELDLSLVGTDGRITVRQSVDRYYPDLNRINPVDLQQLLPVIEIKGSDPARERIKQILLSGFVGPLLQVIECPKNYLTSFKTELELIEMYKRLGVNHKDGERHRFISLKHVHNWKLTDILAQSFGPPVTLLEAVYSWRNRDSTKIEMLSNRDLKVRYSIDTLRRFQDGTWLFNNNIIKTEDARKKILKENPTFTPYAVNAFLIEEGGHLYSIRVDHTLGTLGQSANLGYNNKIALYIETDMENPKEDSRLLDKMERRILKVVRESNQRK